MLSSAVRWAHEKKVLAGFPGASPEEKMGAGVTTQTHWALTRVSAVEQALRPPRRPKYGFALTGGLSQPLRIGITRLGGKNNSDDEGGVRTATEVDNLD